MDFIKGNPMNKLVELCCILFLSFTPFNIPKKMEKEKVKDYLVYVDEITNDFIREMEEETGLRCSGSGGSMPHDVEEFEVMFNECRRMTIEEARWLEVKAIEKLVKKINEHEKIRPFLREYPFGQNRVGISLSFYTKRGEYYLDGSVVLVFNAKNTIFYKKAEKRLIKYRPIYDAETGGIYSPAHEEEEERLVRLHEEPYEEAVKIVETMPPPPPQPLKKPKSR